MAKLTEVTVNKLFGYANHQVRIRKDDPTILTAPNGAGKTHVLLIMDALLRLDILSLSRLPFEEAALAFDDSKSLTVSRRQTSIEVLRFNLKSDGRQSGRQVDVDVDRISKEIPKLPSYLEQISESKYFDSRLGRMLSAEQVERRLGHKVRPDADSLFARNPEIVALVRQAAPILIDTKRLDSEPEPHDSSATSALYAARGLAGARIARYIDRIRAHVSNARRDSVQATQRSDVSFANRALAAASLTVREKPLQERYGSIVSSYERLARNGLAVGERPPEFPEKTTPTVRRILSVFLDDWEQRLQPLLPINEKIETLRSILDSKFEPSGKKTEMDSRGMLRFRGHDGRPIRVASLSSGEQHLVALFTQLLFSAQNGAIVLIDEPEISLHAAWQHAFLADIESVATIAGLQVIIATHSTAIVNGRWDLEEALKLTIPEVAEGPEVDDEDIDAEEFLV